jgi:hypothetical protein
MEGPDIVLSPRIGNVRRTVPENGIRVSEFLPEILAYHRTRGTRTLDLSRIYSFPNGRPDDVAVPPSDAEGDPTHVPFQVQDRSEDTPLQLTDARGSGVHGVEPLAQVSTPAAPDAAHDSMVVHPRTPPPSPPMSPISTISRGRSRLPRRVDAPAPGHFSEPPTPRRALPRGVLTQSPHRPLPSPGSLTVRTSPGPPVLSPRPSPRVAPREPTPEPPVDSIQVAASPRAVPHTEEAMEVLPSTSGAPPTRAPPTVAPLARIEPRITEEAQDPTSDVENPPAVEIAGRGEFLSSGETTPLSDRDDPTIPRDPRTIPIGELTLRNFDANGYTLSVQPGTTR